MDKFNRSQKGQALVLVGVGLVAMIAIVGLAIDGGSVFSDRRHAQNAADTAALAGALAKVNDQDWYDLAIARASGNNYTTGVNNSTVIAQIPPGAGCNGTNGPYAGNNNYVQVIIHSSVDTLFAKILGINQLNNCVEAIAKALPSINAPYALGNALAAMDCHAKWAIKIGGTSDTILIKGGIFDNSDHENSIYVNKIDNIEIPIDKGMTLVGGYTPGHDLPLPNPWNIDAHRLDQQIPCPVPDYWYPSGYTCDETIDEFPDDIGITTDPHTGEKSYQMDSDTTYCVSGNFKQPNYTLEGSGVHIVLLDPVGIHWNGSAQFHLNAGMEEGDPMKGIIIYLPFPNDSAIVLNGSSDSLITGTILAPNSEITLNGDYESAAFRAQIIGRTIDLSGSTNLSIEYNQGLNGSYNKPAQINLSK